MRKVFPTLTTVLFILLVFTSTYAGKLSSVTRTKIALGTYVKITIVTDRKDESDANVIIDKSFKKIEELDRAFDYRPKGGVLSQFNKGKVITHTQDPELFTLIQDSVSFARKTDGYFDPTLLPIIRVWGFDTDHPQRPTHEKITEALAFVGYDKIEVTADRIVKPNNVMLDLSGIAKGRIVDLIRDYIREEGYDNFLIDAGGDIYVSGKNAHRKLWRIAIQDPVNEEEFRGILEKKDTAIVTSGDYERFFIEDGHRYSHLFNPKTGYPTSNMKSVTILLPETAFADAVATAVFAMGSEKGFSFLVKHEIEGYVIYHAENDEIVSRSTKDFWK
ncbi:MAG: FAD:protein FMN transferase [Spirochaetota bacterium]|nr:MAG: FAD:protein FMN transferase [Spirochaetota bacterium]